MSDQRNSTPSWEDAPAFREHFLVHYPADAAEAFRRVGEHLYNAALDVGLDEVEGSRWLRAQVAALALDLRHVARVLRDLGMGPEKSNLSPGDDAVGRRCRSWAGEVLAVVTSIEAAVEDQEDER